MKLFSKRAPASRRQRLPGAAERPASNLAYYSRRSDEELNTGRELRRESKKQAAKSLLRYWLQRFGLVILLIVAIACLLNVLSLSSDAKVVPVGVTSNSTFLHNQATYQAAASKLLAGSIWNRNKITINTGAVSAGLIKQFPELSSVSVTLPLLAHRPLVYIAPSQPALILVASNGSFVLDTNGKALFSSPTLAALSRLGLPVVTDQSGLKPVLQHVALASNAVSFIQTVIGQLALKHFTITSLILPAAASELDVHLDGQPYFVKFNLQGGDPRQQAGTFLATQARLSSQNITPGQYIDVRVDGRAYYQ